MSSKKPSHAKCGLCGGKLNAVPKRGQGGLAKLAKTQKRPERVFGGVLCGGCTRRVLKEKARVKHGVLSEVPDLRRGRFAGALKM